MKIDVVMVAQVCEYTKSRLVVHQGGFYGMRLYLKKAVTRKKQNKTLKSPLEKSDTALQGSIFLLSGLFSLVTGRLLREALSTAKTKNKKQNKQIKNTTNTQTASK